MQLKEMGYSPTLAKAALRRGNNDMNIAIQLLADNDFVSQERANLQHVQSSAPSTSAAANAVAALSSMAAATVAGVDTTIEANGELLQSLADQLFESALQQDSLLNLNEAEIQRGQQAYESLKKDTCSEAEYIDLTLTAETNYLEQYKTLLTTIS